MDFTSPSPPSSSEINKFPATRTTMSTKEARASYSSQATAHLKEVIPVSKEPAPSQLEDLEDTLGISQKVYANALVGQILAEDEVPIPRVKAIIPKMWRVRGKLNIIYVEKNLYIFVFEDEKEKNRIERYNPWLILNHHLNLKPFPGGKALKDVDFSTMLIWIQAQYLPPFLATSDNAEVIASKFPRCEDIQIKKISGINWDGKIRMRVAINLDKALKTGFRVESDDGAKFDIKIVYERLRDFCYNCVKVAHNQQACQRLVPECSSRKFGPWLRADFKPRKMDDGEGSSKEEKETSGGQMFEISNQVSQGVAPHDKEKHHHDQRGKSSTEELSAVSLKNSKRKDQDTELSLEASPSLKKKKENAAFQPLIAPPFDVFDNEKVRAQNDLWVKEESPVKVKLAKEEVDRVCKIIGTVPVDDIFKTLLKPDAIIEIIGKQRFGDIDPYAAFHIPDSRKNQVQPTPEYVAWLKEKKEKEKAMQNQEVIAEKSNLVEDMSVLSNWEKEVGVPGSASSAVTNIKNSARLKLKEEAKKKKREESCYQRTCLHPDVHLESISPTLKPKGDKLEDAKKIDDVIEVPEMARPAFPPPKWD